MILILLTIFFIVLSVILIVLLYIEARGHTSETKSYKIRNGANKITYDEEGSDKDAFDEDNYNKNKYSKNETKRE